MRRSCPRLQPCPGSQSPAASTPQARGTPPPRGMQKQARGGASETALGEKAGERLGLRNESSYFDTLVAGMKPRAAGPQAIDRGDAQCACGACVAATPRGRRLAITQAVRTCARGVLGVKERAPVASLARHARSPPRPLTARAPAR